jgi:AbrB family looped-hinge helix DNA binding protein
MPIIKFDREIRQSGGSAAITVPKEILRTLGWKIGDQVELYVDDHRIVIEKAKQ